MASVNMKMCLKFLLILMTCGFAASAALGQIGTSKEELEAELKGKVLFLRDFAQNSKIKIDADGNVLSRNKAGSWMLAGFEITKVDLRSDEVVLYGNRVVMISKSGTSGLVPARTSDKLQITIVGEAGKQGWRGYLLRNMRELAPFVPSAYKTFVEGKCDVSRKPDESLKGQKITEENGVDVYRVGANVTAPKLKSYRDPEYTDMAREHKFQGLAVLQLTVGLDGKPANIEICRPLGMGLDDSAIRAVREWRFEPAKRDGIPVAVKINVEVNFNLY